MIFTNSMSDFFIKEADAWREEAWDVIRRTPQHRWQILTKRPERILECLPNDWGREGYPNVWLGTTIENNNTKDRLLELQKAKTKNSKFLTFLSVEPLLEDVDFTSDPEILETFKGLDWVILGGESGNDSGKYTYRPCEIDWIESMVKQCKGHGIPVFVKQMGTHLYKRLKMTDRHGGNINEFPAQLRIREFPVKK